MIDAGDTFVVWGGRLTSLRVLGHCLGGKQKVLKGIEKGRRLRVIDVNLLADQLVPAGLLSEERLVHHSRVVNKYMPDGRGTP